TGAHPNDTQEAAHFLWEVALLPVSTQELVSTAIARVLDAEAAQMTVLWHDSAPAQRYLLVALVEWGGRNIYREDYRRRANLGPADHLANAPLLLGIGPAVAGFGGDRAAQVPHIVAQVVHQALRLRAPLGAPSLLHPVEDLFDLRLALVYEAPAGVGDAVDLASILLDRADVAHILEHLQRRIDGAGAGGIEAAEALLERLDQLVAVGRLVLELLEDDVLEIATLEHLAAELVEAEFTA